MPTIHTYKLSSGEEIIGTKSAENATHIILRSVRVLMMQPTGPGQFGLAMIPWMSSVQDGDIRIPLDSIIGNPQEDVPKDLEDAYIKNTTGLEIASGNDGMIKTK